MGSKPIAAKNKRHQQEGIHDSNDETIVEESDIQSSSTILKQTDKGHESNDETNAEEVESESSSTTLKQADESNDETSADESDIHSSSTTSKQKKEQNHLFTAVNGKSGTKNKQDTETVGEDEDEEADFEQVEKIVDVKISKKKKRSFLVRWKNFPPEEDTWEPEEKLSNELIEEFMKRKNEEANDLNGQCSSAAVKQKKGRKLQASKNSSSSNATKKKKAMETDDEDEEEDYEVEKILDVKINKKNKRSFLVRWKNFGPKEDTWEPEENLSCTDLIEEFMIEKEQKKGRKQQAFKNSFTSNATKKKKAMETDDEEDEEEDYEVEKILDAKINKRNKRSFLVRWKNFGPEEDTWEPEENLSCTDLIEEFMIEKEASDSKSAATKQKKGRKRQASKAISGATKSKRKTVVMEKNDTTDEEDAEKEYEVGRIIEVKFGKNNTRSFLIRWKNCSSKDDTWEPEENLHCNEMIEQFMKKVEKAKNVDTKELRMKRTQTNRFKVSMHERERRLSKRTAGREKKNYAEEDD